MWKGLLFEWKEIVPQVVETIRKERAPNAKAVERKIDSVEEDFLDFYKKYRPIPIPRQSFRGQGI
ncbi:MAG: hypothetical protein Q8R34_02430 [bacterium]|nr:hypothetical protein [bacterium]